MASVKLTKKFGGAAYRVNLFTLTADVEETDWLDGETMDSPVKADGVVVRAGSTVSITAISATVTDSGTGEAQARVLFRVSEGHGRPWFWHRITLRPSDVAALEALTLRFTRPRVKR